MVSVCIRSHNIFQVEGDKMSSNFRTVLTKIYPNTHSLVTTYSIIQNTNAPIMINEVQWKILYKVMAYNNDIGKRQEPAGMSYKSTADDVYYDVMHLITCFQLADSTLRSPQMDCNLPKSCKLPKDN